MSANVNLPPVVIHSRDNNHLVVCATIASGLGNHGAHFLLSELSRAALCAVENLPVDVVSLGSRITYQVDGAAPKTCTLVLPGESGSSRHSLSVLTSLGAALIGLRAGARMPFVSREHVASEVLVLESRMQRARTRTHMRRSIAGLTRRSMKRSQPVTLCRLSAPHARQNFSMQSRRDEYHEAARAEARRRCQRG
jgi:regulator of nucleoside diphosphate kinase